VTTPYQIDFRQLLIHPLRRILKEHSPRIETTTPFIMQSPLRILVAENNPDDAFFLRCAFEEAEVQASINFVHDGQELVDYLRGEPPFSNPLLYPVPTMLLLDLDLPRIDGFRFLAWLRKEPRMQDLVVVILSGSDRGSDFQRAAGLGAADYLIKPHNPQQLVPMVRKLVKSWHDLTAQSVVEPQAEMHPVA
jgi:two-component system response regulator